MKLYVRQDAEADLEEAFPWYEDRRSGLGHELLEAVEQVFDRLIDNPNQFPEIHRKTRRANLRRFPCLLLYRLADDAIVVVACFHASRNPERWRER